MAGLLVLFLVAAVLLVVGVSAAAVHRITHPSRQTYAVAIGRGWPASPAEIGLDYAEETFTFSDGARTPVWTIKGRKPGGPMVIITHGWGDGRYGVLPWVELLADLASSVVIYDLRGQGESSAPASKLGAMEVDDLLALASHAAEPGRPIVLLGMCMGAGFSIAAAAREPARFVGVVGDAAYRRGLQPVVGFFRINRWPVWPFYHLVGLLLMMRFCSDRKFDRARHAAKLQCPLLLLHGAEDPISPVEAAREIAAAVPDGRGRLVEFENGGHLDLVKTDPARYRDALAAFFAELGAAAEPDRSKA